MVDRTALGVEETHLLGRHAEPDVIALLGKDVTNNDGQEPMRPDLEMHVTRPAEALDEHDASRHESGSSKRKAAGSRTIARPMATRCRCPPESCFGRRSSNASMPRIPDAHVTRRVISAPGSFRSRKPSDRFSRTVMCG